MNKVYAEWCRQAKAGGIRRFWQCRREVRHKRRMRTHTWTAHYGLRWSRVLRLRKRLHRAVRETRRIAWVRALPPFVPSNGYKPATCPAGVWLLPGARVRIIATVLRSTGMQDPGILVVMPCACDLCALGRHTCVVGGRHLSTAILRGADTHAHLDEPTREESDAMSAGIGTGIYNARRGR